MNLKIVFLACVLLLYNCDASSSWSYEGKTGPEYWSKHFPKCGENRQSPIDLEPCETEFWRRSLRNNYNQQNEDVKMVLTNNGHSAQVDFSNAKGLFTKVFGQKFIPVQVHFHWGDDEYVGSEHTVNGRHYPVEMHFVHMNSKYSNAAEAKKHRDGLLVLGTFIRVGHFNRWLQPIFKRLANVEKQGSSTSIDGLKMSRLMPRKKQSFFFYDGSLTTPTCDQAVKWILFRRVLSISPRQIEKLRSLLHKQGSHEVELVNNFRPTQPLNGRDVYRTFHMQSDVCERRHNHYYYY